MYFSMGSENRSAWLISLRDGFEPELDLVLLVDQVLLFVDLFHLRLELARRGFELLAACASLAASSNQRFRYG